MIAPGDFSKIPMSANHLKIYNQMYPGDPKKAAVEATKSWAYDMKMCKDAYDACEKAEAWDWLRKFNGESFMFCQDPMIGKITEHMKFWKDHSGASFGCTLRSMEYIANHGWNNFAEGFVS
jgi:hypothetical protein